jgi:glycosyltransferase involved in cell wall biosynthesis
VTEPIDVVMLTKNSEHLLSRCLASIYENVPVKNLIIVDGFSTDHTLKIISRANREHGNVTVLKMNGSRARAREEGIRRVSTDWFMFVDSDVTLSRNWFNNAEKKIIDNVGAVWGVNIDVIPSLRDKRIIKLQNLIARQCFGLRGGMHDTLIRLEAVKGIRIPEQLHAYEDAFIINWIKKKDYQIVIVEFRCGLVYSHLYEYMFYYPFFMFHWLIQLSLQGVKRFSPLQRSPKMIG